LSHFCLLRSSKTPCRRGVPCTDGTSMTVCSWAQWWTSRECWRPCHRPCHLWSSIRGNQQLGARAWSPRRPLSPLPQACFWKRVRRCWESPYNPLSTSPPWRATWASWVQICTHLLGGWGLGRHAVRACARAELPRAREVAVCPVHPTTPPHGGLRGRDHGDPAGHMEHGGGHARLGSCLGAGHPAHKRAWLRLGQRIGCSSNDAASGGLAVPARAEPMLDCD